MAGFITVYLPCLRDTWLMGCFSIVEAFIVNGREDEGHVDSGGIVGEIYVARQNVYVVFHKAEEEGPIIKTG